jgi:hypothetical protein
MDAFTCPLCGRTSHSPNDVREQYCGACHVFVADEHEKAKAKVLAESDEIEKRVKEARGK